MIIQDIEYEIIHAANYFERTLFLLKMEDRFLMVYKGSGLNGGAIGRVLPFHYLFDRLPRLGEAREGIVSGYIFKKFYFNRHIISHRKNINAEDFGEGVTLFCDRLTKELANFKVKNTQPQDIEDVLTYAKSFNKIVDSFMDNTNRFDWGALSLYHNLEKSQLEKEEANVK